MEGAQTRAEIESLLELGILIVKKLRLLSPHLKPTPLTMSSIMTECVATQELLTTLRTLPVMETTSTTAPIAVSRHQIGQRVGTFLFGCSMAMSVVDEYVEVLVQHVSGAIAQTDTESASGTMLPSSTLRALWKEDDMKELVLQLRGYRSGLSELIAETRM